MNYENSVLQHDEGLLDGEAFINVEVAVRAAMVGPGHRAARAVVRHFLGAGFQKYMDNIIAQTTAASANSMAERWKAATAGSGTPPQQAPVEMSLDCQGLANPCVGQGLAVPHGRSIHGSHLADRAPMAALDAMWTYVSRRIVSCSGPLCIRDCRYLIPRQARQPSQPIPHTAHTNVGFELRRCGIAP